MGVDNLSSRANGQYIDESWFGKIRRAFCGTLAPRSVSSLDAESTVGAIGSPSYRFKRAYISSGYFSVGMIKYRIRYVSGPTEYNGKLSVGWMNCDGSVIGQASYDAQHGAGAWAADIVSSPLDGKYLPNFYDSYPNNKHIQGTTSATQNGNSAITGSGAISTTLSHTHAATDTGDENNNTNTQASGAGINSWDYHHHTVTVPSENITISNVGGLYVQALMRII